MARNASNLSRKVLQNIRTHKNSSEIEKMLSGVTAFGEIAVQLGDYSSGDSGTSLWTLASGGTTAVRFVNQHYVDARVSGSTGALREEINKIETSVGLSTGGTLPTNWKEGTTYISASTTNVLGAIKDLDKAIKAIDDSIIDELEVDKVNTNTDKIVYDFAQHKGLVGSAQTKNVGEFTLAGYTGGTDTKIAANQKLKTALGNLQAQIDAMDKSGTTEDGKVVTYVTEDDGKVYENKELLTSIKLNGYTGTTGNVTANDTVGQAIDKIEKEILSAKTATSVASADGSITVTTADTGTDIAVNIKSGEKVLAKDGNAGLYTDIKLSGITPSSESVKEEFVLVGTDGTQLGESIKVYKDSAYKEIYLGTSADTINTTTGEITKQEGDKEGDKESLNYAYMKADGTYDMVLVDLEQFLTESEFGDGLDVDGHLVSVKINENSEDFLTVGPNGILLSGVQHAIDEAVAEGATEIVTGVTGDATKTHMGISATTAADGHTVYTFGLYDVASAKELANLSGTVLNLDSTVSGKSTHVNVEIVETDGKLTSVTLGETDIASASALTAEVTRAKTAEAALDTVIGSEKPGTGETRTYDHTNTNYLNGNDSVKKDVEAIDIILGKTTGTTFSAKNSVAKTVDDIKAEIEAAKESLALTATDDDKYIIATVSTGATGTTVDVKAISGSVVDATSSSSALVDSWDAKQNLVHELVDNTNKQGVNNWNVTKIAATDSNDGVTYNFTNLVVDCGEF